MKASRQGVLGVCVLLVVVVACGPSEAEIDRRIDEAVQEALRTTTTSLVVSTSSAAETTVVEDETLSSCESFLRDLKSVVLEPVSTAFDEHVELAVRHADGADEPADARKAWRDMGDAWEGIHQLITDLDMPVPEGQALGEGVTRASESFGVAADVRAWYLYGQQTASATRQAATHPAAVRFELQGVEIWEAILEDLASGDCEGSVVELIQEPSPEEQFDAGYSDGYSDGWVVSSFMDVGEILYEYQRRIREAGGNEPYSEGFILGATDGASDHRNGGRPRVTPDDPEWMWGWLVGFRGQWSKRVLNAEDPEPELESERFNAGIQAGWDAGHVTVVEMLAGNAETQLKDWEMMPDRPLWLGLQVCPSGEAVMDDLMMNGDPRLDIYLADGIAWEFVGEYLHCPPGY